MLSWVKQHATDVSSVIGRDLAEFAEVVAGDTRSVLDAADSDADDGTSAAAAAAAAAALRATGDADAAAAAACGGGGSGPVPDESAIEEALQSDMKTYVEPLSDAVGVARWREATEWSLEGAREEVAAVLAAAPRVATYHAELVPASVSEADFWLRYCYRLHAALQAARRRRVLRAIEAQERDTLRRSASRDDDWGMVTDPKALMKLLTESRAECAALKKKVSSLEGEVAELRKEKAGGGGAVVPAVVPAVAAAAEGGEGAAAAATAAAQEAAAGDEEVAPAAEPSTVDGGEEGGGEQGRQSPPVPEAEAVEQAAEAKGVEEGSGAARGGEGSEEVEAAATPKAKADDWNALADWS